MNSRQRIAVGVGLLFEAALLLYPPWRFEVPNAPFLYRGHALVWRINNDLDIVPLVVELGLRLQGGDGDMGQSQQVRDR